MVWNHSDSLVKNEKFHLKKSDYLVKINTETLLAYSVYQIESNGLKLFEYIKGDQNSIMDCQ